jgi:hypothetical protein
MPLLTWSSKSHPHPHQVELKLDSIIYPHGAGFPSMEYKDSLFLGDNLAIMAALLPRYQGKLDLIYADPPFFTNKKFAGRIHVVRLTGSWRKGIQTRGAISMRTSISCIPDLY